MNCSACVDAEHDPLVAEYRGDCEGCSARSLAYAPSFADSERLGRLTATYRSALRLTFADPLAGHQHVKRWAERIRSARQAPERGRQATNEVR
ncbi:hypothetical protein [Caldimonas tepidiphila]|uniref:hypothetical protein n=1 Tax=Caldimonas tepidiphila TaxID=2315841 RepID=UPI000E5A8D52|nr:hypothetical protein [Caldimonas tepidiphila]